MEIPNIKTKQDVIGEMRKDGQPVINIIMEGMFGSLKRLPEYNDSDEVVRKAMRDIKDMDFSSMYDYVDSLSQMVDFWKEKAEHYLEYVDDKKYKLDENGYIDEINL
jgi:hypothetical protein